MEFELKVGDIDGDRVTVTDGVAVDEPERETDGDAEVLAKVEKVADRDGLAEFDGEAVVERAGGCDAGPVAERRMLPDAHGEGDCETVADGDDECDEDTVDDVDTVDVPEMLFEPDGDGDNDEVREGVVVTDTLVDVQLVTELVDEPEKEDESDGELVSEPDAVLVAESDEVTHDDADAE